MEPNEIIKRPQKLINRIDPLFLIIKNLICHKFFKVELLEWEYDFVMENVNKHRKVLWLNIISISFILMGLKELTSAEIPTIIGALLAPAMVTGGAWFGITFGGIPQKLLDTAVDITFWMFLAFTLSLSTMVVAMCYITPWILWPLFSIIEIGVIIACIMYDNADGLKLGLDDTLLKHSRGALLSLARSGQISMDEINRFEETMKEHELAWANSRAKKISQEKDNK